MRAAVTHALTAQTVEPYIPIEAFSGAAATAMEKAMFKIMRGDIIVIVSAY